MTVGILMMVAAGLCYSGMAVIAGGAARRKVRMAPIQGGAALLIIAVGGGLLLLRRPESGWEQYGVWGVLFLAGALNFGVMECVNRAMAHGHNGIIWALLQGTLIFPFAMGVLLFREELSGVKLGGLAMILTSIFLLAAGQPKGGRGKNGRWMIPAALGFLLGGLSNCFANLPSYWPEAVDIGGIARTVALQCGAFCGFLLLAAFRPEERNCRGTGRFVLLLSGMTVLCQFFLLFRGLDLLAAHGAGAVGYPILTGVDMIGFTLYSLWCLREKLTGKAAAGIGLGLAGVICIAL